MKTSSWVQVIFVSSVTLSLGLLALNNIPDNKSKLEITQKKGTICLATLLDNLSLKGMLT